MFSKKKEFMNNGAGYWKIAKELRKTCKKMEKREAVVAALHRYWRLTYLGADSERAAYAAWYSCALDRWYKTPEEFWFWHLEQAS